MCTVLLPPGDNPIAVTNIYQIYQRIPYAYNMLVLGFCVTIAHTHRVLVVEICTFTAMEEDCLEKCDFRKLRCSYC